MRVLAACAAAALLGVAGCGGADEAAAPPAAPAEPAEPAAPAPPADATCEEQTFPDQGAHHVEALPPDFAYNSFPATSGPHAAPVVWNAYVEPVPELNVVHNLEHGGVAVQFGSDVPEAAVRAAAEWYTDDPVGIVLAPLPALRDRIALTAWTHLLSCDGFDADAFDAFRDAYRYNGPERLSPFDMQPGT